MITDGKHKIKIGIFGGAFDPVHKGHISIVKAFLNSGIPDEIWVLPTPEPPFKDSDSITPYEHRFNMAEIAFENMANVAVSDIESTFDSTSYTINTLRYLSGVYPDRDWYLCIGGDNLTGFNKWKDYTEILKIARLLVAQRPDARADNTEKAILDRTHFVEHEPVNISSTDIRSRLTAGESHQDVPERVLSYIKKHGLYLS